MRVPILMYHALDEQQSAISISPERFAWQMASLQENGYQPVTLDKLLHSLRTGNALPARPVVITFDDGFESVYTQAWPVLNRFGFEATVFLVAGYCGKQNDWPGQPPAVPRFRLMDWKQIQEMARHGIEFGSHTLNHPRLDGLPAQELKREILDSKTIVEDQLGREVSVFAYPYGCYNLTAKQLVGGAYRGACGTELGLAGTGSDPWALERIEIQCVQQPVFFRRLSSRSCELYLKILRPLRTLRAAMSGQPGR